MIINIKDNLSDKNILNVLSYSQYMPTEEKMNLLADKYRADASIYAFACIEAETATGVVVVRSLTEDSVEIRGIAVDPAARGNGIGSRLIAFVSGQFPGCEIRAETDDDAVGFYRSCGFAIESLGEKYPGVVRYLCTLGRSNNDGKPTPFPDSAV